MPKRSTALDLTTRAIAIAALAVAVAAPGAAAEPATAPAAGAPSVGPAVATDTADAPPLPVRATVALTTWQALAARNRPQPLQEKPMQVTLVRLSTQACEPHCPQWIAAEGRIGPETPAKFKKVLAKIGSRKLPVVIHSSGGSVDPALAIGRLIRAKGLEVVVGVTELNACDSSDAACRKETAGGIVRAVLPSTMSWCASSCAFLLAGGTERHVGRQALVGVHQITTMATKVQIVRRLERQTQTVLGIPVSSKTRVVSEQRIPLGTFATPTKNSTYDSVQRYFVELGIRDPIMTLVKSTPGNQVRWLKKTELFDTRLSTTSLTAADIIYRDVPSTSVGISKAPAAHAIDRRPVVSPPPNQPDLFKLKSHSATVSSDPTSADRFTFPGAQMRPPKASDLTTTGPRR